MPRVSRRSNGDMVSLYPHSSRRHFNEAKREADHSVKQALNSGALKRSPCEVCGKRLTQAHHEDYAKPLDVRWLCRYHHAIRHAELREQGIEVNARLASRVQRRRYVSRLDNERTHSVVKAATEAVSAVMDVEGVTESDLSGALGVSRQQVNKFFEAGFRTLKALTTVAEALGYDVSIQLVKRPEVHVHGIDSAVWRSSTPDTAEAKA